eukprot:COSAG02_NODE_3_length_74588_cov_108.368430_16_plen_58_part_00
MVLRVVIPGGQTRFGRWLPAVGVVKGGGMVGQGGGSGERLEAVTDRFAATNWGRLGS